MEKRVGMEDGGDLKEADVRHLAGEVSEAIHDDGVHGGVGRVRRRLETPRHEIQLVQVTHLW